MAVSSRGKQIFCQVRGGGHNMAVIVTHVARGVGYRVCTLLMIFVLARSDDG